MNHIQSNSERDWTQRADKLSSQDVSTCKNQIVRPISKSFAFVVLPDASWVTGNGMEFRWALPLQANALADALFVPKETERRSSHFVTDSVCTLWT